MKEKRKYMRFNVLVDALCRTGGALKKLKVNNFSREGLGLLSKNHISDGEDVEIEIMIPGDNIPVIVTGQIAWTGKEMPKNKLYKSGVRLKKIDNTDRGRILNYIYRRVKKNEQK